MKRSLTALLALSSLSPATAQEVNLGLHLNPTITAPLLDNQSVHDKELRMSPGFGYNFGGNIKLQVKKVNFETGINIVQKTVQFNQYTGSRFFLSSGSTYNINYNSTSLELPFIMAYTIHDHDRKKIYKVDILAGISYEYYWSDGISSSASSGGSSGGAINSNNTTSLDMFDNKEWVNAIIGMNVRAIIAHIGLVEYGVSWHIPFSRGNSFKVATTVIDNYGNQREYSGVFSPKVSYFDFKLCYYLLNFKPLFQREFYKNY